jgi:hypothetical protein
LLAWLALVAIVWPSLGPAPWLVRAVLLEPVHAAGHAHDGGTHAHDGGTHAHDHGADAHDSGAHAHAHDATGALDAADLPGSPTHPIDHECFQCEVLKHLAQSVPAVPVVPALLPPPHDDAARTATSVGEAAADGTPLPPATGPPAPIPSVA